MIACSVCGDGKVTVYQDGMEHEVKLTSIRKHQWHDNNRRTDYWFTFRGVKYHAIGSESATVYRARAVKG